MSQKLTLAVYLEQKGQKAKALKRVEAEAFGIPYPLQAGWPGRHGEMEVTSQMLDQIATTPKVKSRLISSELQRALECQVPERGCDLGQMPSARQLRKALFPGFTVRLALRYRAGSAR